MLDLQQLQVLAQLIDNLKLISGKFEKSYKNNNAEDFNSSKKEILDIQKKIYEMIK